MASGHDLPIIALHGFLGLPSDWTFLAGKFAAFQSYDLWPDAGRLSEGDAFAKWAESFAKKLEKPIVLLGYSMGGRLAMHLALKFPELVRGAVFVSAHPGLRSLEERDLRRQQDADWADRFSHETWSSLLRDWHAQPVFRSQGESSLHRPEEAFQRSLLSQALRSWSLAEQADLRDQLAASQVPSVFVTGSLDEKFTRLMLEMPLGPWAQRVVIEGAGHRVPWDQPRQFTKILVDFVDGLA